MKENNKRPGNTRGSVHGAKNQEIMENTARTDMECANVVVTPVSYTHLEVTLILTFSRRAS